MTSVAGDVAMEDVEGDAEETACAEDIGNDATEALLKLVEANVLGDTGMEGENS